MSTLEKTTKQIQVERFIDALNNKNVVYTKADIGNSIVILDNEDYKQKLEELLEHR